MKLDIFDHVIFDGALQVECMSSEESDNDDESAKASSQAGVLRVRGLPWRSSRLQRFYGALDDGEKAEKIQRPKRGLGKKERYRGPNKEGFFIPPKGVASWMISKQWLRLSQTKHPDLLDVLKKIVVDPPGFDWDRFHVLGEETDEDESPGRGEHIHLASIPNSQ
jgi:hypothetical protein